MNIKCISVNKYSTAQNIITHITDKTNQSYISPDAQKISSKIRALKSKKNQRQKLKTAYGVWFTIHDNQDFCYAVCTDQKYPERHAYGLIQKIQTKLSQNVDEKKLDKIKKNIKKQVQKLSKEYQKLENIDKIKRAQNQVDMLEQQLHTGVRAVIGNKQTLQDMDQKALRMKNNAGQFYQNTAQLQKTMFWKNMRLKIMIGIIALCLIGFTVIMIIR